MIKCTKYFNVGAFDIFRENLSRVEWSAFYSGAQLFSIIKRASVSTRRLIVTFREQFLENAENASDTENETK